MSGHDRRHTGRDRGPEGHELNRVQPLSAMRDNWQPVVRIDVGITMPGKVLGRGDDVLLPKTGNCGDPEGGDRLHILAEGADADDRIPPIAVDIDYRRKNQIDTHCQQLDAGDLGALLGDNWIAGRPLRHLAGCDGKRRIQPADDAAFLIHPDEQRRQAELPCFVLKSRNQRVQFRGCANVIPEEDDPRRTDAFEGGKVVRGRVRTVGAKKDALE